MIELRPETSKVFYNRAMANLSKGEFERAIPDFDRAVRLTPDYAPAFRNRGNAYRATLAFDRAIQDFDEAIRLSPEYAVAFTNRGVAHLNKATYDWAIQDFDRAIRLKSDEGLAYRGAAWRTTTPESSRAAATREVGWPARGILLAIRCSWPRAASEWTRRPGSGAALRASTSRPGQAT